MGYNIHLTPLSVAFLISRKHPNKMWTKDGQWNEHTEKKEMLFHIIGATFELLLQPETVSFFGFHAD